jgi:penicillin-binding protein 1A
MEKDWVDFAALDIYTIAQPSVVLDDEGAIIAKFELDKRAPVAFDKLPKNLIQAFVAAEDHSFFTHSGISARGIVRSALVNFLHGKVKQGASTITQQIARLMFLSYERTWFRKIQEVFIAMQLERQLSKEQILELYLNNIYFGRGIYGVEAACRRLWSKPLQELSIPEAATLAGVAASARLYSPLNAPGGATKRRNIILNSMRKLNFITTEEYKTAVATPMAINDFAPGNPIRMYVQEWVRQWAEQTFGKDVLYQKGLKIKTSINTPTQEHAEQAFSDVVHGLRVKLGNKLNGGMMSLEPSTGKIKAMIGGYDFKQSQFNRATQAYRQVGSTFKPILFALAMRAGIEMDSVFIDEPIEMEMPNGSVWRPINWYNSFNGPMTLARALTRSVNTIAIKLFMKISGAYVAPWSRQFGITKHLTEYPSAALGTAEATVEENAAAFNVFANNGVYTKPYLIEWVKDEHNNKIYEATPNSKRILDPILCSRMVNVLELRMLNAKKQYRKAWISSQSIGKTGSTNGASTTWFVGATPTLTTALYIGCDDNTPMGSNLLASRTALPIWHKFYLQLPATRKRFFQDPSLHEYHVNWITGEPANSNTETDVITLLR